MKKEFLHITHKYSQIVSSYKRKMNWIASKNFSQKKRFMISRDISERYEQQMEELFQEMRDFYLKIP